MIQGLSSFMKTRGTCAIFPFVNGLPSQTVFSIPLFSGSPNVPRGHPPNDEMYYKFQILTWPTEPESLM